MTVHIGITAAMTQQTAVMTVAVHRRIALRL
jgi:hypothetical protein